VAAEAKRVRASQTHLPHVMLHLHKQISLTLVFHQDNGYLVFGRLDIL
jgi:hypothetical protein